MARITMAALVILFLMNSGVVVMEESGFNDDVGVDLSPGGSEAVETSNETAAGGFNPSQGGLDTLFTVFTGAMKLFDSLIQAVFAAPIMFENLGVPSWFVTFVFSPLYLLSTIDIIYMASGRRPLKG